jgi:small-conductance mechanosensitive channel
LIYIPNSQLALKTIFNVRRSGHQWHSISLDIDYDTPIDKIQALERRIGEELRQYPQYIYPNYDFGFGDGALSTHTRTHTHTHTP